MSVKYGKFEMPDKIKLDEASQSPTFARFIIEPFERGFGHTVGNALRRILLASLEAPAIISVRIEGVPHEYMAIDGVIQDMTHIILNLKGVLLRRLTSGDEPNPREIRMVSKVLDITDEMIEKGGGEYGVTVERSDEKYRLRDDQSGSSSFHDHQAYDKKGRSSYRERKRLCSV